MLCNRLSIQELWTSDGLISSLWCNNLISTKVQSLTTFVHTLFTNSLNLVSLLLFQISMQSTFKKVIKRSQGFLIKNRTGGCHFSSATSELGKVFHASASSVNSSVGKESACNAGDTGLIRESGRSRGEDRLPTSVFLGFPCASAGKEFACNVGDLGSIPGLGRSPGEGKDYPPQYSGLENSMDSPWGHKEFNMINLLSCYEITLI